MIHVYHVQITSLKLYVSQSLSKYSSVIENEPIGLGKMFLELELGLCK